MTGSEIVKRIDEILKRKNLKRLAVADAVGVSTQSFTHWSRQGSMPAADKLFKIADFLGVSTKFLLTGEQELINEIPENVLNMAYEIMALNENDINEMQLMLDLKKKKYLQTDVEKNSSAS